MACPTCIMIARLLAKAGLAAGPAIPISQGLGRLLEGDSPGEIVNDWLRITGFHGPGAQMDASLGGIPSTLIAAHKKKKRAPSKYNKVYSKNFKALKRSHPRTSFNKLVKMAHAKTRRELA